MAEEATTQRFGSVRSSVPATRFLVEAVLKSLASESEDAGPRSKSEWISHLGRALMSGAEQDHQEVLTALVANGVSTYELRQSYVPEAARYLGEKWITDEASFVDVTTGASRLQALFRQQDNDADDGHLVGFGAPPDQSVLMAVPHFEQHSLGAVVASDSLRRHGLCVRMAIGLSEAETAHIIRSNRFSMVGISAATWKSVEKLVNFIGYMRANVRRLPPIVVGGRIVEDRGKVEQRSGADFAVKSIREAIDCCDLAAAGALPLSEGAP